MANNDELITGLQSGEELRSAKPSRQQATSSRVSPNASLLAGLQNGTTPTPTEITQSSGTPTPIMTPTNTQVIPTTIPSGPSRMSSLQQIPLMTVGVGAAVVLGIFLTFVVGRSILNSESTTTTVGVADETDQDSVTEDIPPTDQGPPTDIPAFAAAITPSVVLIECTYGQGSGFILDAQPLTGQANSRLIVTNQHVIEGCEGAGELRVVNSRSSSIGSVIDFDTYQDLAIIDAPDLTGDALTIGPVPDIGQWAMAAGSPIGITDTVTFGNITNVKLDQGFILSDVLIGPGNSGGPLVDNQGRVLAVNTAVLPDAEGFSLSVPISNLCDQLLNCP